MIGSQLNTQANNKLFILINFIGNLRIIKLINRNYLIKNMLSYSILKRVKAVEHPYKKWLPIHRRLSNFRYIKQFHNS